MEINNILLDPIKAVVLNQELKNLEFIYINQNINPIYYWGDGCVVYKEVYSCKDFNELGKYLVGGGSIKPNEVNQYISDLYFNNTNQFN